MQECNVAAAETASTVTGRWRRGGRVRHEESAVNIQGTGSQEDDSRIGKLEDSKDNITAKAFSNTREDVETLEAVQSHTEPWASYRPSSVPSLTVSGNLEDSEDNVIAKAISNPHVETLEAIQSHAEPWASYRPSSVHTLADKKNEVVDSAKDDSRSECTPPAHTINSERNGPHPHETPWASYQALKAEQTSTSVQGHEECKDESWTSYRSYCDGDAWSNYHWQGYAYAQANLEAFAPKDGTWASHDASQGYPQESRKAHWAPYHTLPQYSGETDPWSSYQAVAKDFKSETDTAGHSASRDANLWRSDSPENAKTASKKIRPERLAVAKKWWHSLEGECCPISLTPLETLQYEPFGLLGGGDGERAPTQGVWGKEAANVIRQGQAVHWFDGAFLASFLVSGSSLIDPVNRRNLTRGECVSLDAYLSAFRLPAVHVTDSYDLLRHVSGKSGSGRDPGRIAALEREAATLLGSLFDFRRNTAPRSNRSGVASNRAKPSLGPATGLSAGSTASQVGWVATDDTEKENSQYVQPDRMSWPDLHTDSMRNSGMSGKAHQENCMQNIDTTSDEENILQVFQGASDPTPAEACRGMESVGTLAPSGNTLPRASRPAPRSSRGRGSSQRSVNVVASAKKTPSALVEDLSKCRSVLPEEPEFEKKEVETDVALSFCDVQVPNWASVELHEKTLDELQAVEAMFPEEFELLTPMVQQHLEACVANGSVSSRAEALCFRLLHRINDDLELLIEFSLPPYYPTHSAMIELSWPEGSSQRSSLRHLEQSIRTNVLKDLQGSEVLLAVLDWLNENAPVEITTLQTQRLGKHDGESEEAPAPTALVPENGLTKQERIEQARAERMAGKYSEAWDLCYAFVKHGACKEKNCQWRHAVPGKDKR